MSYLEKLDTIIREVIEPAAIAVDRDAKFPRAAITALGKSGLLGLVSATNVAGMGLGLAETVQVVERIGMACPSTAMVVSMHYCGTAVIEKFGAEALRRDIAAGRHLTTLAWSESGSRSNFWAPIVKAVRDKDGYLLNGTKTMVTTATEADSYVWSSAPAEAQGLSTLWLVDSKARELKQHGHFDGLGMRGNCSAPITATSMRMPASAMLGVDGGGFDIMMGVVLPMFATLITTSCVAIMDASINLAAAHVSGNRLENLNCTLADLPTIRSYLGQARIRADMARLLRDDTVVALATNRADAMLRVLEGKAGAAEATLEVTDIAMRVCGGAAFRKDVGVERLFRDARAAASMAPTSDVLFDFIGKVVCNMPLFG
jgi:alkylation response protein AidB-like acyl-CoA dehydrogenase